MLHEHQGSGSLEIEGGRERDENLEGTRHSGNNKYQISKINALSTVILAKVQPLSDVTVLYPKSGYMTVKAGAVTDNLIEYGVGYLDIQMNS